VNRSQFESQTPSWIRRQPRRDLDRQTRLARRAPPVSVTNRRSDTRLPARLIFIRPPINCVVGALRFPNWHLKARNGGKSVRKSPALRT